MIGAGLSLDQAPPPSVPFRFFVTAPVFGVAAAGALAAWGPAAMQTRWALPTVAVLHLVTLGLIGQIMAGAIFQMLPVVAGAPVRAPRATAAVVHGTLTAGAVLLPAGLGLGAPHLVRAAVVLLGVAFATLAVAGLGALARARARSATVQGMRLALVSLVVAAAIGVARASAHGWTWTPTLPLTELHAAWALAGWVGLLVMSVAYQVVPMLQLTRPYPRVVAASVAPVVFVALVAWTVARLADAPTAARVAGCVAAAGFVAFAATTAALIARRRRRPGDATRHHWYLALAWLGGCSTIHVVRSFVPALDEAPAADVVEGTLFVVGFAMTLVGGMIQKIVPFLCWFHLQARSGGRFVVPHMRKFISDRAIRRQLVAQAAATCLLAMGALRPARFTYPAAAALAVSSALLGANVFGALRVARRAATVTPPAGAAGPGIPGSPRAP